MRLKLNQPNALDFVEYWEKYKTGSGVYIEFVDFDEVEVSLETEITDHPLDDAIEYVKNIYFNIYN